MLAMHVGCVAGAIPESCWLLPLVLLLLLLLVVVHGYLMVHMHAALQC